MKYTYDSFCIDSQKNGVEGKGKSAYPLHKQISEDKNSATKYGNNGLGGSSADGTTSDKQRGY